MRKLLIPFVALMFAAAPAYSVEIERETEVEQDTELDDGEIETETTFRRNGGGGRGFRRDRVLQVAQRACRGSGGCTWIDRSRGDRGDRHRRSTATTGSILAPIEGTTRVFASGP